MFTTMRNLTLGLATHFCDVVEYPEVSGYSPPHKSSEYPDYPDTQNFLFTFDQKIEKLSGLIIFSHNLLSQTIKTLNYLIFYFLIKISPIFVRWWVSGDYSPDTQKFTFTFF